MRNALFDMPREPLILETQDAGYQERYTERWPFGSGLFQEALEIFLRRKGWNISRVKDLQESISKKLTVDMFTGETEPLSPGEKELQRDIDYFLKGK